MADGNNNGPRSLLVYSEPQQPGVNMSPIETWVKRQIADDEEELFDRGFLQIVQPAAYM